MAVTVVEISVNSQEERKMTGLNPAIYGLVLILAFVGSYTYFSSFRPLEASKAVLGISQNFVSDYDTYQVSISPEIEGDLRDSIISTLSKMEFNGVKRFEIASNADTKLRLGVVSDSKDASSYIVPVTDFYSIKDDVTRDEIISGTAIVEQMFVGELLSEKYGDISYKVSADQEPFRFIDLKNLDHTMRLLSLDGKYFLDNEEGGIPYGVIIESADSDFAEALLVSKIKPLIENGFNRENLAKINMTGVTAITRNLALKVDASGDWGYSSEKISDFLKDADLTHVSNEISFVPGCTPSQGMRFCSRPEYIKSLEDSGVDIVELTGNHNNDYGAQYNTSTIETYKDKGWDYFGGGLDIDDASKTLYKEVKGSTIAFIGYNYYDTMLGTGAIASDSHAGSNSYSEEKMRSDIVAAKETADVVIVDFQFQECYSYPESGGIYPICYKPLSYPDQQGVFRKAVDFGADIVIGTQAHQPQTYEIYEGKSIYYGLGNLFFDQIYWVGTRQGIILTHYIYEGKLLQTKMTTTYYDNDMKTYVTEGEDRQLLLELLRDAR